jgi:hypothetical protein
MGLPYDLKNTLWVGYEHPYIPTSEVFYSVNFTVGEYTCTSIGIKNMGSPNSYCLVVLPENESTYVILYSAATLDWLYSDTFEFIDGDDIANVDLLHFMYSSFGYLDDMAGSYWTWPSSETFEDPDGFGRSFEFSANGTSYYGFYAIDGELTYYPASGGSITAYDSTNGWASDDYKSLIAVDAWSYDQDVQNVLTNYMVAGFLPAPDVIISYKGAEIATMSDSGTKTLQTQGKYCEGDIMVSYTKSGGGGGGSVLTLYTKNSNSSSINAFVDAQCTQSLLDFYGYDYGACYDALLAASAIRILDERDSYETILFVNCVYLDRVDDSLYGYANYRGNLRTVYF